MLTNFLGCPTIDDEATKMEEPQPFLNRETEDSRRLILAYLFQTIFHIITKDCGSASFFRKKSKVLPFFAAIAITNCKLRLHYIKQSYKKQLLGHSQCFIQVFSIGRAKKISGVGGSKFYLGEG